MNGKEIKQNLKRKDLNTQNALSQYAKDGKLLQDSQNHGSVIRTPKSKGLLKGPTEALLQRKTERQGNRIFEINLDNSRINPLNLSSNQINPAIFLLGIELNN